jgi:acetyltransferase
VYKAPSPTKLNVTLPQVDPELLKKGMAQYTKGLLSPNPTSDLLKAANIPTAYEVVVETLDSALKEMEEIGFPMVMKVVGPIHKTDVGGVVLNVSSKDEVVTEFNRLMAIKEVTGVLMQPQLSGIEIFVGARKEGNFGHVIMCGLGGIYIEVFKDIRAGLSPVCKTEARTMIDRLKIKPILSGYRGKEGINLELFAEIISRVSALVEQVPEIEEMDLNPLMGSGDKIFAVDARIIMA